MPPYRLVQAFNPAFAAQHINAAWVDALPLAVIPPLAEHMPKLKQELPAYLVKCAGIAFDHTDVKAFTAGVLAFWKNHGNEFPTYARSNLQARTRMRAGWLAAQTRTHTLAGLPGSPP